MALQRLAGIEVLPGILMPRAASSARKRGRTPVATKWPSTTPSAVVMWMNLDLGGERTKTRAGVILPVVLEVGEERQGAGGAVDLPN